MAPHPRSATNRSHFFPRKCNQLVRVNHAATCLYQYRLITVIVYFLRKSRTMVINDAWPWSTSEGGVGLQYMYPLLCVRRGYA